MERFPSCCLETSCYPFLLQSLTVAAHPSKNWEAMYPLLKKADAVPEWNLIMAVALLGMLPPLLVVLGMQKLFVRGLVETEK